jgi:hypothetical protein
VNEQGFSVSFFLGLHMFLKFLFLENHDFLFLSP